MVTFPLAGFATLLSALLQRFSAPNLTLGLVLIRDWSDSNGLPVQLLLLRSDAFAAFNTVVGYYVDFVIDD